MRKLFLLAPLALVMVLTGCDDAQISYGARSGVIRISDGYRYGDGIYIRNRMNYRQRYWRDYNRHRYGGHPGWNRRIGHGGDWNRGRDWNHGGRGHDGGHRGGHRGHGIMAEGMIPMMATTAQAAPALTKEDVAAYAQIGKAYGVSTKAATNVMESLNRAAVGDFGGLADLGLNAKSLKEAKANDGRLAAAELDRVSRRLGVSSQKADSLIQAVLK